MVRYISISLLNKGKMFTNGKSKKIYENVWLFNLKFWVVPQKYTSTHKNYIDIIHFVYKKYLQFILELLIKKIYVGNTTQLLHIYFV